MPEEIDGRMRLTLILAGLVGGLIFGALAEFNNLLAEPAEIGLHTFVIVCTTAFVLTAAHGRAGAAMILALLVALLMGGLSYKVALEHSALAQVGRPFADYMSGFWYSVGMPVTAFVLTAFGLAAVEERRLRFPYGRMFRHLFGFPVQLAFGAVVVGLLNLLIFLWGELFEIINIDVIGKLWNEPLIFAPMSGAFAGLGVALARQWHGVTAGLRTLCRFLARFALPIFAAFTLTLLIALPVQGLTALFESRSAAGLMSALAVFTIFLVYGARQDLTDAPPLWLRLAAALSVLGLPVYTGLAAYAMWLRVGQYGFTPERYVGLVLVLILFLHAAGLFAVQVLDLLRRRNWLPGAGVVNMTVLALVAAFFIALHAPPLHPAEVSARSQYHRLAAGRVQAADFDFGYLQFRLGPAGRRALERLERLDSHPESAVIREKIAEVRNARSYWEHRARETQRRTRPPEN